MANVNAPSGLSPVFHISGAPWNQQTRTYWIPSTDLLQYNIGDIVKSSAGVAVANDLGYGSPLLVKAASGNVCRGVIVGCGVDPLNLNIINIPATKTHDYYISVVDDPSVVFQAIDDGITTANLVSTAVGKNCNFTVTNPTSPSPVSATVLTSSSFATTNTHSLKIVGIRRNPANVIGAYCQWLVKFNTHELVTSTGTTGV